MIQTITENVSCVLFCGFIMLFVLPRLLENLFYILPSMLWLAARGKVRPKGALHPLFHVLLWPLIIAVLYAAAFLINRETYFLLLDSPTANLCWFAGSTSALLQVSLGWQGLRRRFHEEYFLQNATDNTLRQHREFLLYAEGLSPDTAQAILHSKRLNYLERSILRERAKS